MIIISLPAYNGDSDIEKGDTVYFSSLSSVSGTSFKQSDNATRLGVVVDIDPGVGAIHVVYDETIITTPPVFGDYIMFEKNSAVNSSSLIGYYADVKFKNNSDTKIELFAMGSKVSESSK